MANPVLERKGGTQLLRKVAVWLGAVINNQISITLRMKKTKLQYNQKLGFKRKWTDENGVITNKQSQMAIHEVTKCQRRSIASESFGVNGEMSLLQCLQ
jgi:hypothetical protein